VSAPAPGTFWRHAKSGNPYVVVAIAKIEAAGDDGPDFVVYRRVDEDKSDDARNEAPWKQTWIRPLHEWEAVVEPPRTEAEIEADRLKHARALRAVPRFTPLVCHRCGDARCPPQSESAFKAGDAECIGWRK